MITPAQRAQHRAWLEAVTVIPTAAGREQRVIRWIENWVASRSRLTLRTDKVGNLLIRHVDRPAGGRPIDITAHLDHPAFVVHEIRDRHEVVLEFRGGVHTPYFENARIELFDQHDRAHRARIETIDDRATPFKMVTARIARGTAAALTPGDVGRWAFSGTLPRVRPGNRFETHACDDLAAVAAALSALDVLHRRRGFEHVGILFTRAEEIGFVGAIGACKSRSVPKKTRLICLENSRSFADSPIGSGPIVRVGDRLSVFEPDLTNRLGAIMLAHAETDPTFRWQRKLMPGGACEATAFSTYGYESTCVCLPLGNYHNMRDIDGVLEGRRPAKVGPECISLDDYHGLVELLVICCGRLDDDTLPPLVDRMERLWTERRFVL